MLRKLGEPKADWRLTPTKGAGRKWGWAGLPFSLRLGPDSSYMTVPQGATEPGSSLEAHTEPSQALAVPEALQSMWTEGANQHLDWTRWEWECAEQHT